LPVHKLNIEEFLSLAEKHPVLDVRSPGEYRHAHIPDAHSFPLFTDEERKVVGTVYKQQSRNDAIKIGLDYFGPKMKKMVEEAEAINNAHPSDTGKRTILVHCWRGGMRSAAIAWLLDLYGFKVYSLAGGYKKFRQYVLETFALPFSLKILGGYTGSGKSELLHALNQKGELIIDLEDIAKHKGSAFGSIGMPVQPSQEMFENMLALELRKKSIRSENNESSKATDSPFAIDNSPIWLEDESQRIGQINIPRQLWDTMRRSPIHFLDIPFEDRLRHIVDEYGRLDKQKMIDAIGRIKEKLGGLNAKIAIQHLEDGDTLECFRILLHYYDKYYFKALQNREGLEQLLHKIHCETVTTQNVIPLLNEKEKIKAVD
jgi:tRNA 2-selenouridine synthase